jgi:hypothetical protein
MNIDFPSSFADSAHKCGWKYVKTFGSRAITRLVRTLDDGKPPANANALAEFLNKPVDIITQYTVVENVQHHEFVWWFIRGAMAAC